MSRIYHLLIFVFLAQSALATSDYDEYLGQEVIARWGSGNQTNLAIGPFWWSTNESLKVGTTIIDLQSMQGMEPCFCVDGC